ncbi:peptidylprolyl isomerase [Marinicella rhabdoformis]|uniref:peptidylprolyl isomerase n=1 Tax=Marinicella rhabdoformis TaxID=2580566 RepID=UPI0012AEBDEA|nr:peptidylprolyl isomerase [Marinicella rhabdoformis]
MKRVVLMALCLAGCTEKSGTVNDSSEVLAVVGDIPVTANVMDVALKSRGLVQAGPAEKQAVFDELIREAAMANQAVKSALPLNAEQLALLQYQQMKYQAHNALESYLKKNPVTDADIAAEYEKVIKATKGLQFHVQHLLFKDEVEAVKVLDGINGNDYSFEQAMTSYVAARPNVRNVGDIGWVNLQQMPEPLRLALEQMSVGQLYPEVVLSDFGAHVLYLKDKKTVEPPSLAEASAGIKKTLEQRLKSKFTQLATAKAKVKVLKQ